jgi:hypothetical protein
MVIDIIPKGHSIVKTIDFKSGRIPTLLEAAVAAATVFLFQPYYGLFKHQCYWYSDVLMQVLRITFLPDSDDDIDESTVEEMLLPEGMDAGQFMQAIEDGSITDLVKPSRGGKLMQVQIYWARKALIKMVTEDYKRRLAEVQDGVCISDFFLGIAKLTWCTD